MSRRKKRQRLKKAKARLKDLKGLRKKAGALLRAAKKLNVGKAAKAAERAVKVIARKAKEVRQRIKKLREALRRTKVPGVVDGGWHPKATRNQVNDGAGPMMNVPAKLVWHTTEGYGLPLYSGSHPHFTLNPKTGELWQHISIRRAAMALRNLVGGVETNRANAIQVELIGFAKDTGSWPDSYYRHIAELARWIEKHAGVKRRCGVKFVAGRNTLSDSAWLSYAGHLGHQHVPENDHWDPGAFRIDKVLR